MNLRYMLCVMWYDTSRFQHDHIIRHIHHHTNFHSVWVCRVGKFLINSFNNAHIYNTALLTRSQELKVSSSTAEVSTLGSLSLISCHRPNPTNLQFTVSKGSTLSDLAYKWDQTVFAFPDSFFVCIMSSKFYSCWGKWQDFLLSFEGN